MSAPRTYLRLVRGPAGYRVVDNTDPGRRVTVFSGTKAECDQFLGSWLIGQADQASEVQP